MEVKIGIQSVPRELVVETDTPPDEIEHALVNALADGEHQVFTLSMSKGGKILVPADKIAYVEFGTPEGRRMGFGNIVLLFGSAGRHAGARSTGRRSAGARHRRGAAERGVQGMECGVQARERGGARTRGARGGEGHGVRGPGAECGARGYQGGYDLRRLGGWRACRRAERITGRLDDD